MTLPVNARDVLLVVSVDDDATAEFCSALTRCSQGLCVAPWGNREDSPGHSPIDSYIARHAVSALDFRRAPHEILEGVLHDLIGEDRRDGELVFVNLPWRAAFDFGLDPETSTPLVLDYFAKREVSIVHLVRRDPLQLAVEQMHAKAKAFRLGSDKIRLEPEIVCRAARDVQAQQCMLSRFASAMDARCLRIICEELYGGYASINLRRVFRMMGSFVSVTDQASVARPNVEAASAVVNIEEILDEVMRNYPDLVAGLPSHH